MVGGNAWLLANAPSMIISQPIDFAIPKEEHTSWYTYGSDTFPECVRSIRSSVVRWIVPFLDHYQSFKSLTFAYENNEERILKQRHFYIRVAAAYLLLRQPQSAIKTLEDKLGQAGPKRDYAKAFEYVEKILASA